MKHHLQISEFNQEFVKNIIRDIPEESIEDIHKLMNFIETLSGEFVNHLRMTVDYDLIDPLGKRKMILAFNGGWFTLCYKNKKEGK